MRKIMISVIAMMMVIGLMVSCDNANITPEQKVEELVSVTFDEGASRGLTGSIEAFNKDNYYWKYAAQKADTSGLISGQTPSYDELGAAWMRKDASGNPEKKLGTVRGFSQGYWNFKLFAYTDAEGNNLAYTGEVTGQLLQKSDAGNTVLVRVAPLATGTGTLWVDTANISLVPKQNNPLTDAELASFAKEVIVKKFVDGAVSGSPIDPATPGTTEYSLDAGTYKVTVKFVRPDNITYAEGDVIATVYSNVTTIISGYLDEITTEAGFDSDAEVINKIAVSGSVDVANIDTAITGNITLSDSTEESTNTVTAVVNKDDAKAQINAAVNNSAYKDVKNATRSASLSLKVDTTAATKSSVTLEIGMSSTLTTTVPASEGSDPVVYTETSPIKELDDYVTVEVKMQKGLSNVVVTHNGAAMQKLNSLSDEITNRNGAYYYDDVSYEGYGLLTIKTNTFSPFEVSYDDADYTWYNYPDEDGIYKIGTASQLVAFERKVNRDGVSFSGKIVKLTSDIDLLGYVWNPVGQTGGYSAKTYFQGIFDGDGYTISNLYIPESTWEAGTDNLGTNYATGFFGFIDAGGNTIKNVTFENANVAGHHWVGVAVGYMTGTVSGVTVTDSTITSTYKTDEADGDKAGGVVGYLNSGSITGCTVTGSTISAVRDCGSVAGHSNGTVTGNTAENCTVYYSTDNNEQIGGEIAGRRATGVSGNTATNVTVAKVVSVSTSETFTNALKGTDENIVVNLTADVTYDDTPWNTGTGTMGGNSTQSITINGNGHSITFNNTNSDWNGIYIANGDATLTINNAKLSNSGYNDGPWNRHDINFHCKVVLNNVTSDTAIAVANDSTLYKVDISDSRANDDYLLWIQALGQKVNVFDCNIHNTKTSGTTRGIAIKDQYISSPSSVTLNVSGTKFVTTQKAAVLVTSTAGANITWGEGNNIEGVLADRTNAVWNDSDRTSAWGLVTVTGCTILQEKKNNN